MAFHTPRIRAAIRAWLAVAAAPRRSRVAAFAGLLGATLAAGCAAQKPARPAAPKTVTAARPPLPPGPAVTDDVALKRAVGAVLATLDPTHPRRAQHRAPAVAYLTQRGLKALAHNQPDQAYSLLLQALQLYSPEEIAQGVTDAGIVRLADAVRRPFARRGAEAEVLVTLTVLESMAPNRADIARERALFERWLDVAYRGSRGDRGPRSRRIELYEEAVKRWPSPKMLTRLEALYLARESGQKRLRRPGLGFNLGMLARPPVASAYELARLHLRRGNAAAAASAIAKLSSPSEAVSGLQRMLVRAAGTPSDVEAWIHLARVFDARDRDVSFRVCAELARRIPTDARPLGCAARQIALLGSPEAAIILLERAARIAPTDRGYAAALLRLYETRVLDLVSAEKLPEAREALVAVERYAAHVKQLGGAPRPDGSGRDDEEPTSLEGVTYVVGQGHLNGGDIKRAVEYFKRSLRHKPSVRAYVELGKIRLNAGEPRKALELYQQALALPQRSPREGAFSRARLLGRMADAYDRLGQQREADRARKEALALWEKVLGSGLNAAGEVEAYLERGRLLYHLGRHREAIEELSKAIDADPERGDTYAQVIAFLTTRGQLAPALDVHRRALGRPEVSTYLRTYSSLWIVDLQRLKRDTSDGTALDYLRNLKGDEWHHELARYTLGTISYDELLSRANTVGKKAEAYYYESMRRLAAGKHSEAQELWQKVLATNMMGFFEYEMASYFLRRGPAAEAAERSVATPRRPGRPSARPRRAR